MSQCAHLNNGIFPPRSVVEYLSGDAGGLISPDYGNNVFLLGGTNAYVTGNPVTNTLSIAVVDSPSFAGTVTSAGSITTTAGDILLPWTTATAGHIKFGGNTCIRFPEETSTFLGSNAGNDTYTGRGNVGLGSKSLGIISSADNCTGLGWHSLSSLTTSSSNTAVGDSSLVGLRTGDGHNIAIGTFSLSNVDTGAYSICVGSNSGDSYFTNESSNICIGYNTSGTVGESNKLRIGRSTGIGAGEINASFIAGIYNITPTIVNTARVTIIDSAGQIGSLGVGLTKYLLSGVTGNLPVWETDISVNSVTAEANITTTAGDILLPQTTTTKGHIKFGGEIYLRSPEVTGVFLGYKAGNDTYTGSNNIGVGGEVLAAVTTSSHCTGVGSLVLKSATTSRYNTAVGAASLNAVKTGNGSNTAIGSGSLSKITIGAYSTCLGTSSGFNYTTNESSNICIGYNAKGTVGESHKLRIGNGTGTGNGEIDEAFIAGIYNEAVSATSTVVLADSDNKLGGLPSGAVGAVLTMGATAPSWEVPIITCEAFQRMDFTGFYSWEAAGPYFDDTTLGTFQLLVAGTGYIKGEIVTWVAQDISGMTSGACWFIYIDDTGTIGKTSTRSSSLFVDYVVLFECLYDETVGTKLQHTVKENHPYNYPTAVSNYQHDIIGAVIENENNGANIIAGSSTLKISISGDDVLADHGLDTTIPAAADVTFRKFYKTAGGKWAQQNNTNTFTGFYNNAGTPAGLTASKYGVYRLYVSKDTLNATTPTYYAVLHTAQYNNNGAALTAISNGSIVSADGELMALELAQLGYITFGAGGSGAGGEIVTITIAKSTLRSTISGGVGSGTASGVTTNASAFNGMLSGADTNVQAALDTIDNWGAGTTDKSLMVGNGIGSAPGVIAVGGTGTILTGITANDPTWTTATYPSTIAKGDVVIGTAANVIGVVATAGATDNYVLTANGAGEVPTWQADAGTSFCSDAEAIAGTESAKAVAPSTLKAKLGAQTSHGLVYGAGTTTALAWTAEPTDGQILIGDTGAIPQLSTITAGTGISIANAAHSITLSSTATTLNDQTGTTYTLVLSDAGKLITCTNASDITVTVPTNAAVAFPIGTAISFFQGGAGQVILSGAIPPTLRSADNAYKTTKLYSVSALIKIATDVWIIGGDVSV